MLKGHQEKGFFGTKILGGDIHLNSGDLRDSQDSRSTKRDCNIERSRCSKEASVNELD